MKFFDKPFGKSQEFAPYVVIVVSVFLISSVVGWFIVKSNTDLVIERTNEEIKSYTDLSTNNIVDSYTLYYDSGYYKFRETIGEILKISDNISGFILVDPNGSILFDSAESNSEESFQNEIEGILEKTRTLEPVFIYKENSDRIEKVVYPYVEEWGRHPYTVIYFVDYEASDNAIATLRNLIIAFVVLVTITSVGLLIYAVITKELLLKKKEKKELEELNKQKEDFLMLVTHNLRTPLTRLDGYVSLLKIEKNKKTQNKTIKSIENSIKDLDKLVKRILAITSIIKATDEFKYRKGNLGKVAQKTISGFRKKLSDKKIKLKTYYQKYIPDIMLDRSKIEIVILSFLENAIIFSGLRKKITISVFTEGPNIVLSVEDRGVGISEKEKEHIFKLFGRATDVLTYDYPGTGLSLFMSMLIVKAHEGKIWFESEEGKGSTFSFSLPIKLE